MREQLWGADKLEAQLESAKDDLRGLEKNIRKILGKDVPVDGENAKTQMPVRNQLKRPIQEDRIQRRLGGIVNDHMGNKRRRTGGFNNQEPKTVFSRLSAKIPSNVDDSGDEDDIGMLRPAVSSRVIITPREIPSRQEVLRRENVDEVSRQRNKRMFGALLGTLQKFCQEETKLKAKEDKKAEVEARVDEAKKREQEELKRERQQLFTSRKKQLAQVKALENKLSRSKQYQEWREAQIPLLRFIRTKAKPHIYWTPKRSMSKTDTLIEQSSKTLKAEIDKREKLLLDEFKTIEGNIVITTNENDEKIIEIVREDLELNHSEVIQKYDRKRKRNRDTMENRDQGQKREMEEEENFDPNGSTQLDITMDQALDSLANDAEENFESNSQGTDNGVVHQTEEDNTN